MKHKKYNLSAVSKMLGISKDSLRTLLTNFFSTINTEYYNKIESAVKSGDFEEIHSCFHSLKGPLSWFDLKDSKELCQQACDYSLEKQMCDYKNIHLQVKASLEKTRKALKV